MDIVNKISLIISENSEKPVEISENTNLRDELNLDSFGAMMILNGIEDEFNISIDEDDFDQFIFVGDIVKYLDNKLKG